MIVFIPTLLCKHFYLTIILTYHWKSPLQTVFYGKAFPVVWLELVSEALCLPVVHNPTLSKITFNAYELFFKIFALKRAFIANPDLVARFAIKKPLNTWDDQTFYVGSAKDYIDYPVLRHKV